VRIIGAKVSSFDPSGQVVPQRRDCLAGFLDGFLNTFGHGRARSFGVRGSPAVPAPDADRGGEMVGNRLQLVLNRGPPLRVVESFCLVQLLPQIIDPAFVFCFSPCVQHWGAAIESARDASIGDDCCYRAGEQFPDMELTSRIAKQGGEIVEAASGFKQCGVAVISNNPVIVLS
jgi:hypothetical protein